MGFNNSSHFLISLPAIETIGRFKVYLRKLNRFLYVFLLESDSKFMEFFRPCLLQNEIIFPSEVGTEKRELHVFLKAAVAKRFLILQNFSWQPMEYT